MRGSLGLSQRCMAYLSSFRSFSIGPTLAAVGSSALFGVLIWCSICVPHREEAVSASAINNEDLTPSTILADPQALPIP
jgi:hypothetical protein